jgi:hypothetical protein
MRKSKNLISIDTRSLLNILVTIEIYSLIGDDTFYPINDEDTSWY